FGVFRETLTPYYNLPIHVRSVLSQDLTAMVPRLAAPEATVNCAAYASFAETVRAAGTTHVLSLDPIDHPTLQPMAPLAPRAIAPLAIHIYTVVAPRAFAQVVVPARAEPGAAADAQSETLAIDNQTWRSDPARGSVDALQIENDSLTVRVHTGDQACLVVRQNALPGWSARVDGRRVKVHAANGRYLAVRYEAGAREIRLDYDPPHRTLGLTVTLLTAIGMIVGLRWQRYSAGAAPDQEGRDRAQQDHEIEP
ncbi:MAG: YfhO family protein, partial [Vicinamibacteria bacterium]|nr:YfhO family protein [Vicinamibacteria bacterium]